MAWEMQEYAVCSGSGWTASVLWYTPPDHSFTPDLPDYPDVCADCSRTSAQHDPQSSEYLGWRITGLRVLNLTTQRHRVTVGDAKTQDDAAWVTNWYDPGADLDDDPQVYPGVPSLWMVEGNGYPYRVKCE